MSCSRRARRSRPSSPESRTRSRGTRPRRGSPCRSSSARWTRRAGRRRPRSSGSANAGSRSSSGPSASPSRARATWPTCAGSRRSRRRIRRSGPCPVCVATLEALGLDLEQLPGIKLDLDDRPQKSPRACVIASDPPSVVHLITRAQGGLHDYQAFLHEAGHALHYASVDPDLPYTFRKFSRDHALTEIYSYIVEAISPRARLARRALRSLRRGGRGERRGDDVPRGAPLPPLHGEAAARARLLGPFPRGRRHPRRLLRAPDRRDRPALSGRGLPRRHGLRLLLGRLPARLDPLGPAPAAPRPRGGRGLVAEPETGERLRQLWREGTKPTSEEIAARLGFDPLDTAPLLHELDRLSRREDFA